MQKTTIISTGMSSMKKLEKPRYCFKYGSGEVLLFHCMYYPAPIQESNLKNIEYLRNEFNVEVGF